MNLLSWIIFTPLIGAIAILFLPKDNKPLIRGVGLASAGISLVNSLVALFNLST